MKFKIKCKSKNKENFCILCILDALKLFFSNFSEQSNVNIIDFCKTKDNAIEIKYNMAEDAKEAYKQLLNENLTKERRLREQKYVTVSIFLNPISRKFCC